MMDEKLRYFWYAAQTLSFKKTAEHFYVSPTAVSKGISKLESEIGVKLFNRYNNSIELSRSGRAFYENTKFLLSDYQSAIDVAQGVSKNVKESITIGFSSIYEAKLLSPLLNGYLRTQPNIILKLKHRSIEQLEQEIINGTVDVGFTFADIGKKNYVHSKVLYTGNYVVGVSAQSPFVHENRIGPHLLGDQTVGFYSQYSSEVAEKLFVQGLKARDFSIGNVLQFESYESLMLAVSLDQCVVFVPEIFVSNWDFPGIRFVETKPKFDTYEFVALTKGVHHNFRSSLVNYVQDNLDNCIKKIGEV